jgi:hypothetical protein
LFAFGETRLLLPDGALRAFEFLFEGFPFPPPFILGLQGYRPFQRLRFTPPFFKNATSFVLSRLQSLASQAAVLQPAGDKAQA